MEQVAGWGRRGCVGQGVGEAWEGGGRLDPLFWLIGFLVVGTAPN